MADIDRKRLLSEASRADQHNRKRTRHDSGVLAGNNNLGNLTAQSEDLDATVTEDQTTSQSRTASRSRGSRQDKSYIDSAENDGDAEEATKDTDTDFIPPQQPLKGKGRKRVITSVKETEEIAIRKKILIEKALKILKITDNDMIDWNRTLHLPMKNGSTTQISTMDDRAKDITGSVALDHDTRILPSDTKQLNASSMTREFLIKNGGWFFGHGADKFENINSISSQKVYPPVTDLDSGGVPLDSQPFTLEKGENGQPKISKECKPARLIVHAWKRFMGRLVDKELVLQVPVQWAAIQPQTHPRPNLPLEYIAHLNPTPSKKQAKKKGKKTRKHVAKMTRAPSYISEMEDTPKKNDNLAPLANSSEPLDLSLLHSENARDTTPGKDENGEGDTESDSLETDRKVEPSSDPIIEALALQLIRKHKLTPSQANAEILQALLNPFQVEWDRNERKRAFCNALEAIERNRKAVGTAFPLVEYMDEAEIKKMDEEEHTGNITLTADTPEVDDSAMEVGCHWTKFGGMTAAQSLKQIQEHAAWKKAKAKSKTLDAIPEETALPQIMSKRSPAELEIERSIGSLFSKLFKCPDMQEHSGVGLPFPSHMRQDGICPFPDFAVRPCGENWKHLPALLRPCVGSSDAKPLERFTLNWEAQLALNSLSTLIIMICMYIDTRKTALDPLPPWMFIPAWIYTEIGFTIYIHYPSVEPDKDTEWAWKFRSFQLVTKFQRLWKNSASNHDARVQALAAMIIVRSHMRFIMERIRLWTEKREKDGKSDMVNRMIARAYYEEKNYKWVVEKAGLSWEWKEKS